jgi:anthranilate/para-aminobenzoate synthase component I
MAADLRLIAAVFKMVTDLERTDLGRVCEFGSVEVKSLRTIEEYQTVFQAVSTVEGQLRADQDGFDLLQACFPGGSVTGCPKIRAMRIIEQQEPHHRGLYTGALGYMSFTGDMDFSMLIRTLLATPDKICFHVGGGIVADSDPLKEYEETWVKARAMVKSLRAVFKP